MEKAVIVLTTPDEERQVEIVGLTETAGYLCVGLFKQLKRPRARYFIGLGKVEEIREFVASRRIDLVVFEDYLTSRQVLSLEKALKASVIDKFDLILNIFE
ncbi:MAG: GTPase HflX, partial [Euryarchaeota archaeon]|nr:GTPase HflX [Euryarchaeota archaeon]